MKIEQIKPEETYPLRLGVLKTCDAYQYKYEGDFDESSYHFGAIVEDRIIAIVSLIATSNPHIEEKKQMQLRGMAVSYLLQEIKIGERLVKHVVEFCENRGYKILWCNARENAVEFYKKQGFKIFSQPFNIENVGIHYQMYFDL